MNSPGLPNVVFLDDQKHKATEIIDALQSLLYLIQLDASKPAQVRAYVEQSDALLSEMKRQMLSEEEVRNANIVVPTGKSRVLVIDDEHSIATTLAIIFSNAGYDTRAVESAEAALELLRTEKWVPQLTIIDVHLPGMNGIDLAITLKAQYPEVQVSLFSGRAATADLIEEARQQGHDFNVLPKPLPPAVFLGLASSLPSDTGNDSCIQ
jgi:CheY-like chemotaxis protein